VDLLNLRAQQPRSIQAACWPPVLLTRGHRAYAP
jgi:hypothetical protein